MHNYNGSCSCGAVKVVLKSKLEASEFQPRSDAPTCEFCFKFDGVWISDPNGQLIIESTLPTDVKTFATDQVRFHFCSKCHDLVYAAFSSSQREVAVARRDLFRVIALNAKPTTLTNFEGETLQAGAERRIKNWTPLSLK